MRDWILVRERTVGFPTLGHLEIDAALPLDDDGEYGGTDSRLYGVVRTRREWNVDDDGDGVRIAQRSLIAGHTYLLAFFGIALGTLVLPLANADPPASYAAVPLLLTAVAVFVLGSREFQDPISLESSFACDLVETRMPWTVQSIGVLALIGVAAYVDAVPDVVPLLATLLFAPAMVWSERASEFVTEWTGAATALLTGAPRLTGVYLTLLTGGNAMSLALYVNYFRNPVMRTAILDRQPLVRVLNVFVVGFGAFLLYTFWKLAVRSRSDHVRRYERVGSDEVEGRVRTLSYALVLVVGAVTASVLALYASSADPILPLVRATPELAALILVVTAPAWYAVVGCAFQLIGTVVDRIALWRATRAADLDLPFEPRYPVRVKRSDGHYLGAPSFGVTQAIVVGEATVESFPRDELAAAIAHEEAHLERGDSALAFWTAVLSPFCLTGRTVFYALQDFRHREYAADEYALDRLDDPEGLLAALDRLESLRMEELASLGFGASPLAAGAGEDEEERGWFDRVFRTFHGVYGVTRSHPRPTDRRERVEAILATERERGETDAGDERRRRGPAE